MIALITRIINGGHILIEQQSFNCKLIANVDRTFKHLVNLHPSYIMHLFQIHQVIFLMTTSRTILIKTFSVLMRKQRYLEAIKGLDGFKPDIKILSHKNACLDCLGDIP